MITRQLRVQQQLQRLRPWQLWGRWLPQLRGQQQQLQLRHQQLQQQIASAGARLSPLWRPGQERRERLALQWTALSFSSLMEQFVLLLLPLMCGALVHHRCQLHPFHLQHPTWLVCLRHHPQLMLWVCLRHLECRALVHLRCQLHQHQTWLVCLRHHPQFRLWVRLRRSARGALVHLRCQLHPH